MARALSRMIQLAHDDAKKDASKTPEQYYSGRVAKLLAQADLKFDGSFLQTE